MNRSIAFTASDAVMDLVEEEAFLRGETKAACVRRIVVQYLRKDERLNFYDPQTNHSELNNAYAFTAARYAQASREKHEHA